MTTSVGGVVNYRVRVELRGVRVEVHHTVVVLKQMSCESYDFCHNIGINSKNQLYGIYGKGGPKFRLITSEKTLLSPF